MISPVRIKRIARPTPISRQIARAAAFGHEAGWHGHFTEARAVRSDTHIAERRHLQADADRGAVDGGDGHLRQIFELAHGALQNSVTQIVKKILAISL